MPSVHSCDTEAVIVNPGQVSGRGWVPFPNLLPEKCSILLTVRDPNPGRDDGDPATVFVAMTNRATGRTGFYIHVFSLMLTPVAVPTTVHVDWAVVVP
jgi:hypothetical protein